jgi:hypothetical protein
LSTRDRLKVPFRPQGNALCRVAWGKPLQEAIGFSVRFDPRNK